MFLLNEATSYIYVCVCMCVCNIAKQSYSTRTPLYIHHRKLMNDVDLELDYGQKVTEVLCLKMWFAL